MFSVVLWSGGASPKEEPFEFNHRDTVNNIISIDCFVFRQDQTHHSSLFKEMNDMLIPADARKSFQF